LVPKSVQISAEQFRTRFPKADPNEIKELLTAAFLPTDSRLLAAQSLEDHP
jgi:hypothetical protein